MLYFLFFYTPVFLFSFFFNDTATTEIYTLSLHELFRSDTGPAIAPVEVVVPGIVTLPEVSTKKPERLERSEEHTSELQSQFHLVCRLLLEKKKKKNREVVINKTNRSTHNAVKST